MAHDTPLDLLSAGERPLVHSSIRILADLRENVTTLPNELHHVANEAAHELQHAGWKPDEGEDQQMYWPTPPDLERKINDWTMSQIDGVIGDPNNIGKAALRPGDAGLMDACATFVWAAEAGLL